MTGNTGKPDIERRGEDLDLPHGGSARMREQMLLLFEIGCWIIAYGMMMHCAVHVLNQICGQPCTGVFRTGQWSTNRH